MLTAAQALARILALMLPTSIETIPLQNARGRVLATPVVATRDQPPFPASAMDGYALRRADLADGKPLIVIGQSKAGQGFAGKLGASQAVRIFTGAPVPDGADYILIQEDAEITGDTLKPKAARDSASYIRAAGGDFRAGFTYPGPKRLTPADIALLAAMNAANVQVHRKPTIALIVTGDELVMPGDVANPDQIYSSNGFALAALLGQYGADPCVLPIARDSDASLNAAFDLASDADLIVTLGGASVGDHDLVQKVATSRGLVLEFWKVNLRPGKPLIVGRLNNTPLIGLPGNPVSALVCAHIFLRPALDAMLGLPALPLQRSLGTLSKPLPANGKREHYMRGIAAASATGWLLAAHDSQDSSQISVLAQSNALIVAPPNQPALPIGAAVEFILL